MSKASAFPDSSGDRFAPPTPTSSLNSEMSQIYRPTDKNDAWITAGRASGVKQSALARALSKASSVGFSFADYLVLWKSSTSNQKKPKKQKTHFIS